MDIQTFMIKNGFDMNILEFMIKHGFHLDKGRYRRKLNRYEYLIVVSANQSLIPMDMDENITISIYNMFDQHCGYYVKDGGKVKFENVVHFDAKNSNYTELRPLNIPIILEYFIKVEEDLYESDS